MITLARRYQFCASHRLHNAQLSDAGNQRLYGKCNNPYGHGHDYVLDVEVTGEVDPVTGLIVDVAALDSYVRSVVLTDFAHRNLNADVPEFAEVAPTTENLASVIAERLSSLWRFRFRQARLSAIRIQETERNSFELRLPVTGQLQPGLKEGVTVNA